VKFEPKTIVSIKNLLIFTIIGFLTGMDFTDSWGCVIYPHLFFLTPLSVLTLISITVLYIANKTINSNLVKKLLIAELIYYVTRLIVFKGGYAVGFGGIPDPIIIIYDAIALGLRIFLLKKIFSSNSHYAISAGIIIGCLYLKSTFFAIPPYYFYQEKRDISKGRKIQTELAGKYIGNIQYQNDSENMIFNTEVIITSDSIKIEAQNFEFTGMYYFLLESKKIGLIRRDNFGSSFYLDEFKDKRLNFSIEDENLDLYRFKLKKLNN